MVKSSTIQQSGKKLMNSLMDTHTKIVRPVKSFVIKSSMEFASRSLSVFNKLNAIEMNHKTWISENETHESFDLNNNVPPPAPPLPVFKKPFEPVTRKRKCSFLNYKKNVKKWIKYSLEDTPISSDAKNTAVALQFLDELRKTKEKVDEMTPSDGKLIFRKPEKRCQEMSNSIVSSSGSSNSDLEHHSQSEEISAKRMKSLDSNIKLLHLRDNLDDTF